MTATAPQGRIPQEVVEEVQRRASVVALARTRVRLTRSSRGFKGLCPFHTEKSPSFVVDDDRGTFHCFGCGAHGDALGWMKDAEGLDFRDAVIELAQRLGVALPAGITASGERKPVPAPMPIERRAAEPSSVVSSAEAGRWMWQNATPARGEIVEAYLRHRGLDPALTLGGVAAIDQLRFHPRCPVACWRVGADPRDAWLTAPAMLVPVLGGDGLVHGVRVTWLRPDGRGEAQLPPYGDGKERPKRKIFGAAAGGHVWIGNSSHSGAASGLQHRMGAPVAVGPSTPDRPADPHPGPLAAPTLIVGEGFETTWAYAQAFGAPCHAVATLSLSNLQGGWLKLNGGATPLWNVQIDPDRPPFVLPGWTGKTIVLVDADMKPLRDQKVQDVRGAKPVTRTITSAERTALCATLSVQHWRRAGAGEVTAVRPRMGEDFNDSVRSEAA